MSSFGKKVVAKGEKHNGASSAYTNPKKHTTNGLHKGAVTGKDSAKVTYHGKKSGICK